MNYSLLKPSTIFTQLISNSDIDPKSDGQVHLGVDVSIHVLLARLVSEQNLFKLLNHASDLARVGSLPSPRQSGGHALSVRMAPGL